MKTFKSLVSNGSLIGLQCESGDVNDCFQEDDTDYQSPIGCDRMLIFTQSNRTCGISCDGNGNQRSRKMAIKEGWTFYVRFFNGQCYAIGNLSYESISALTNQLGQETMRIIS